MMRLFRRKPLGQKLRDSAAYFASEAQECEQTAGSLLARAHAFRKAAEILTELSTMTEATEEVA